ncbi:ethyl tert-butyl ether degradation protein EthD [Achromobacter sp. AONIH1]|uniref:ethyl tert-butyl ether degradation protein EthD n=1 Tax=unclassified Achromobacter TaxID=2626865 RepID=UPI000CD3270A|nr:ethyl tert-butyl ether degradation protein EthD [Achromobacter sp. AONIH1]AUT45351.1 ethyl tert-butyl ether degradation protein EthD [Achromobacter sp. AONIH1]
MDVVMFLTCRAGRLAGDALVRRLAASASAIPGLREALLHEPASASDPCLETEAPPTLVAELHFDNLLALEAAATARGALARWLDPRVDPWLGQADISHQAMMSRRYAAAPGGCTYLVAYHGHAQDHDAWLGHYLDRHVPLMLRLPGLRALEVCTRLDWRGGLRWPREDAVQRNKVVFDDASALDAALRSDVRMEMRRDFEASPIFHGGNVHYPMTTRSAPMHASSASLSATERP